MGTPVVHRIANLDIPGRFDGTVSIWLARVACTFIGIGFAVVLRLAIDVVAPGVAPFALVYPAALVATLLGGWQSGLATLFLTQALAWVFVMPTVGGVHTSTQIAAAGIVAITGTLAVFVGEGFRVSAQRIVAERNAKLKERELLFRELQHRVTNDFTIVNSLLDLQRRRSNAPETRDALEQAMGRVRSIARIHRHIYALPEGGAVDIRRYLNDLCEALRDATLPPAGIRLSCDCEKVDLNREVALSIGLVTNELVTNAVKHAFPDGRDGTIEVRFARTAQGWRLSVIDDGIGIAQIERKYGLGTGLIESFVSQAGGALTVTGGSGTAAHLDLPPSVAV
jgi:two-component sensor histidine kinase